MTAVLTGNNRATRDAVVPALTLKEDGSTYKWRMFFDGFRKIAEADTEAELIEVLIPGYEDEDPTGKLYKRIQYLKGVQSNLRAQILARVDAETWESLTEEEQSLVEWSSTEDPDANFGEDGAGIWVPSVPLVLIDVSYKPFSDRTAPMSAEGDHPNVSNIYWLRGVEEIDFLQTLHKFGYVHFGPARGLTAVPRRARLDG